MAAIQRLPLTKPLSDAELEDVAAALDMGGGFAMVNQLPHMQSSRKKNGMTKELVKFSKLADRLCQHINEMHREAISAVSPKNERHIFSIQDLLRGRIAKASEAIQVAPSTPAVPSNHRLAPKQLAEVCGQMFFDLTGKRPVLHYDAINDRRSGPFLTFVEDVFKAFRVTASAEYHARHAEDAGDVVGGNGGVTIRRIPRQK